MMLSFPESRRLSRRYFLKPVALAAALGPLSFPKLLRTSQTTLKIAKWAHFLPEFDLWFEASAREWGARHDTVVKVDNIPVDQIWRFAMAEAKAGRGHDIFIFPWPPAEFQRHAIDHAEIYDKLAFEYGAIPQIAHRSTFNPKTKTYFAVADFWIPSPFQYFEDYWAEANMPLGPVHYGSLRSGGQRVRAKLGIPCGLALAPTLEGHVTANTLFYAFRVQVLDPAGDVTINKNAFTIEALKYVKALNQDAGTPDEFAWGPSGNVHAMLARRTSCTSNAISLLRTAETQTPEVAKKIRLQPPLLGPYGVTAFPHATNCSLIWSFSRNQETARQFVHDLIASSKIGYEKSMGCNFPVYPKTLPNLIVRLENDAKADPPHKYGQLKDALHWTPSLGAPGFATPVWMETFNRSVIPRMLARFVKGELTAEDAARAAEAEVKGIAEKWKDV